MPPPANIMPTVDQILAQQRRPGLPPVPTPATARQAPANGDLGLLGKLSRALSSPPANALPPPSPTVPAAVAPVAPAAPLVAPAAPALPRASPRTEEIHRVNVMRLHELIGGPFTHEESHRINQVAAAELLKAGQEASDDTLVEIAQDLLAEFGAGSPRRGA